MRCGLNLGTDIAVPSFDEQKDPDGDEQEHDDQAPEQIVDGDDLVGEKAIVSV